MSSCSQLKLRAFLCLASLVGSLALAAIETPRREALEPKRVLVATGNMYAYELRHLKSLADLPADPLRSKLVLLENGRRLGPAHSSQDQITTKGAGRYLHLDRVLYFSASDNSDVRQNNRSYEVAYVARVDVAIPTLVFTATLIALFFFARAKAGGTYTDIRPGHVAAAFTEAGGHVLLNLALLLFTVRILVLLNADVAAVADFLDLVRRSARRLLAVFLGVGVGTALYLALRSPSGRAARALALLPLLAIGALVSSHPASFLAAVSLVVGIFLLATRVATERFRQWLFRFKAEIELALPSSHVRQVWLISAAAVALTLVNVTPEVVRYWDQSGWMDSRTYDVMAHDIARGVAPFGNSEYAPLYQFSMAALYWTFGHFFFVQQLANVALACVTTLCMCWATWFLFRNLRAIVVVALFVSCWHAVHHAVWYTQIENVYLPVFATSLLALAYYLSHRHRRAVAWMAAAAALVFCTRQQGAFYVLALALAVLLGSSLSFKERVRQLGIYGVAFTLLGVIPWSLRNWHQEDRFSPSSRQSIIFLAVFNDPRIPLHGIRYWERSAEVRAEWEQRYADTKGRSQAMQAYFRQRLMYDTGYFGSAAPWRLAAFYGVLPDVYLGDDWAEDKRFGLRESWLPHLKARYELWVPVVLSVVALAWRWRSPCAWLLMVLISANVLVGLLVGSAEPRNSYPVLLLHFLLITALVAPLRTTPWRFGGGSFSRGAPLPLLAMLTLAAPLLAFLLHVLLGGQNQYRAMPRTQWTLRQDVQIDAALPLVTYVDDNLRVDGHAIAALEPGKRYRARLAITAYMFPPRYMKGLANLDPRLALPQSVQYFSAFISRSDPASRNASVRSFEIPLRYDGSQVLAPLKEHQLIEAEFRVEKVTDAPWVGTKANWSAVEKAVVLFEPNDRY